MTERQPPKPASPWPNPTPGKTVDEPTPEPLLPPLLPCPFCGHPPTLEECDRIPAKGYPAKGFIVRCSNTHCQFDRAAWSQKTTAVEVWNNRTTPLQQEGTFKGISDEFRALSEKAYDAGISVVALIADYKEDANFYPIMCLRKNASLGLTEDHIFLDAIRELMIQWHCMAHGLPQMELKEVVL